MNTIIATTAQDQAQTLEIMQNKLDSLLANNAEKNEMTLNRIQEDGEQLEDRVLNFSKMVANQDYFFGHQDGKMTFEVDGETTTLHKNAVTQLAQRNRIPTKYANELIENDWGRDLLSHTFSEHLTRKTSSMLVRSVQDETRAFLSNSYRRINSVEVYRQFIQANKSLGAQTIRAQYDTMCTWIETVIPKVFEIPTENNGKIHMVFGARMKNSDYGHAATEMRFFGLNVVCFNGLVSEKAMREIHLGKKYDNIELSRETYLLDTRATASAARDIVNQTLEIDNLRSHAKKIFDSTNRLISTEQAIKKLENLTKKEQERTLAILTENDSNEGVVGSLTDWKLAQAVTSLAKSQDSAREQALNELAGTLVF